MELAKILVLDANILISIALGRRVPELVTAYAGEVWLCTPHLAFGDAVRHLELIGARREWPQKRLDQARAALEEAKALVGSIDAETYAEHRDEAVLRIGARDHDDWPVVAVALTFDAPIWTQDQDFFGTGIATWTTDRVELYLDDARPPS